MKQMKRWLVKMIGSWKENARTLCYLLAGYVGCYLILTPLGRYSEVAIISGKTRIMGFWAIHDQVVWEPKFMRCRRDDLNFVGFCYLPLIEWDRRMWHKTIWLHDPKVWGR